ncbi:MAG: hypothetical protein ACREEM_43470, partial [Blastocatellia bacterium]
TVIVVRDFQHRASLQPLLLAVPRASASGSLPVNRLLTCAAAAPIGRMANALPKHAEGAMDAVMRA